jgi:hypothetical protein
MTDLSPTESTDIKSAQAVLDLIIDCCNAQPRTAEWRWVRHLARTAQSHLGTLAETYVDPNVLSAAERHLVDNGPILFTHHNGNFTVTIDNESNPT